MCFSNKQHYVSPLKKKQNPKRTVLYEDLQMLMPSRNLPVTCGLTLTQKQCWIQDSETKFLLLEL